MRHIKPIDVECIEEYLDIYLQAYPAYKSSDHACRENYRAKTLRDMSRKEDVDFIGCFQGDTLVGIMKMVNFSMNLYGQMQPAIGLMSMAVHPFHKKKGIAQEMMTYYETYTMEMGGLVAILLPFRFGFYRKLGYGLGARMDEYHLETKNLPADGQMNSLVKLESKDLKRMLDCYEEIVEQNHGMLMKFSEEIWDMEQDESTLRVGYESDGKLKGYMAYHFEEASSVNYTLNTLVVDELVYEDGQVLKSFLTYLYRQGDLAQTVLLRSGEEDFYHLLMDPQHNSFYSIPFGYLQTNVSAVGNMYKIPDLKRFVESTSYREFPKEEEVRVKFFYRDEILDHEKAFVLCFKEGKWYPGNEEAVAQVSITARQGDLSSLFLNASSLSALIRLGVMEISEMSYVDQLDRLFRYGQKPYSNNDF